MLFGDLGKFYITLRKDVIKIWLLTALLNKLLSHCEREFWKYIRKKEKKKGGGKEEGREIGSSKERKEIKKEKTRIIEDDVLLLFIKAKMEGNFLKRDHQWSEM